MEVKRLLFVTDLRDVHASFEHMKRVKDLSGGGFDSIHCILTAESAEWGKMTSSFDAECFKIVAGSLNPEVILATVKKEGITLIAVDLDWNSHESVLRKIISKVSVPLLLLNGAGGTGNILDHVILAMDWTVPAERALAFALKFRERIKVLDMIHVINEKLTVRNIRELRIRLGETRKVCLDVDIDAEFHIYAGKTGEELVTAAGDYRGTVIILGTGPERPVLKRLFSRTTVEQVAGSSPVPVFIIPGSQ
ncbi:MAG: universal stress protein [Deltaproteobacteria bacterium]|nr:universal stress protein [Deltaproteobacteria bacterium]